MTLTEAIEEHLSDGYARIRPITYDGIRYWLKRRERLGLRMRLQKGNAARAFDAERAALKSLNKDGLPVAELVADGADWMVLADGGVSLKQLCRSTTEPRETLLSAFSAAGQALAELHAAGRAHGRPAIKDMLWDGTRVTFIDLERFSEDRNAPRHFAFDVILFLHSIVALHEDRDEEIAAAVTAYRAHCGEDNWQRARRMSALFLWLQPLLWPIGLRKAGRAKDIRAVVPTLRYLRATV